MSNKIITDEIISNIRACLLSCKKPMKLRQLQYDYLNEFGVDIPFKEAGFVSLEQFLERYPHKVKLSRDAFGYLQVSGVIDANTEALARLILGQRNSKKKKSLPKPRRTLNRSNYSRQQNFHSSSRSQSLPRFKTYDQQNHPVKGDDLWIKNAAYFLNNCDVYLLNVLSPQKVCFRLLANDLDEQYKVMLQRLNDYYKENRLKLKQIKEFSKNKACVAYLPQEEEYLRCIITEILSSNLVRVYFVDEGFEENAQAFNLYELENEFRQLNFQAITANLNKLDQFGNNIYIIRLLKGYRDSVLNARKVQSNPLIIDFYENKDSTESLNNQIINEFNFFVPIRLEIGHAQNGFICHYDDNKKLFFFQLDEADRTDLLVDIIKNLNDYVTKNKNCQKARAERNHICACKLKVDGNWYRAKILHVFQDSTALVEYIDYGNEDRVPLDNLIELLDDLDEYKYIPNQCVPLVVTNTILSLETINDIIANERLVQVKVTSFNNQNIPYGDITVVPDEKSRQDEHVSNKNLIQAQTPESDDESLYKKFDSNNNISFENLKIDDKFEFLQNLEYNQLKQSFFPCFFRVVISHVVTPSHFCFCLEFDLEKRDKLEKNLNEFYHRQENRIVFLKPSIFF